MYNNLKLIVIEGLMRADYPLLTVRKIICILFFRLQTFRPFFRPSSVYKCVMCSFFRRPWMHSQLALISRSTMPNVFCVVYRLRYWYSLLWEIKLFLRVFTLFLSGSCLPVQSGVP